MENGIVKSRRFGAGLYFMADARFSDFDTVHLDLEDPDQVLITDDGQYTVMNTLSSFSASFTEMHFDVESGSIGIWFELNEKSGKPIDLYSLGTHGVFFRVDKEFEVHVQGYVDGCNVRIVTQMLD